VGSIPPRQYHSTLLSGGSSGGTGATGNAEDASFGALHSSGSDSTMASEDQPQAVAVSVFKPGCFACPRRGEIVCAIQGWAAMLYDAAVRHLEAMALSQFAVINHDRYFVSQVCVYHENHDLKIT
jgi:hypothetical protein